MLPFDVERGTNPFTFERQQQRSIVWNPTKILNTSCSYEL